VPRFSRLLPPARQVVVSRFKLRAERNQTAVRPQGEGTPASQHRDQPRTERRGSGASQQTEAHSCRDTSGSPASFSPKTACRGHGELQAKRGCGSPFEGR